MVEFESTLTVLFIGGITFFALRGLGMWVASRLVIDKRSLFFGPFSLTAGLSIHLCVLSLFALAGLFNSEILIIWWGLLLAFGGAGWWTARPLRHQGKLDAWAKGAAVLLLFAWVLNLMASAAPSSKVDEVYYHMLLPKRLLEDGGLIFYQMPWQAAVLPQMLYQIGCSVFHALKLPDAGNVLSILIAGELLLLGFRLAYEKGGALAAWLVSGIGTGVYGASWWVTSGAHALGDFASASLCLLVLVPEARSHLGKRKLLVLGGLLGALAVASKVTLIPLVAAAGLLLLVDLTEGRRRFVSNCRNVLLYAVPFLILLGPISIWTWIHSGSPFGPILAGWFGSSVYDVNHIQEVLQTAVEVNQPGLMSFAYLAAPTYPAIYWLGWGACLILGSQALRIRTMVLLVPQLLVIVALTHFDLRFLGGVAWALAIVAAPLIANQLRAYSFRPAMRYAMVALLIFPWLSVQAYYLRPFLAVSCGLTSREDFREEYIAFWKDYQALDSLLPEEAVIVTNERLNAFYTPRRVVFAEDLPTVRGRWSVSHSYEFRVNGKRINFNGYVRENVVYRNESAKVQAFRKPGAEHGFGKLTLSKMTDKNLFKNER